MSGGRVSEQGGSPVRYRNAVMDNARWQGFEFRADDIVITTPPKCGTTLTQMMCALLILQDPDFDVPLSELSPWLDMQIRPVEAVFAQLAAQRHRRFIKTHTPLDGLPWDPRVTYIGVGRDPREIAMSWDAHRANIDMPTLLARRGAAVGNGDLAELLPNGMPIPPDDARDRFWEWMDAPLGHPTPCLRNTIAHLDGLWQHRLLPNVVLLHYTSLTADPLGQLRMLAERLGVDVPADRLPGLAAATGFERMRARAARLAPEATTGIWRDSGAFFHGGSGRWRDLLDADDLARYERTIAAVAAPDLSAWVHTGAAG
jgi:hypothetical protein